MSRLCRGRRCNLKSTYKQNVNLNNAYKFTAIIGEVKFDTATGGKGFASMARIYIIRQPETDVNTITYAGRIAIRVCVDTVIPRDKMWIVMKPGDYLCFF
jgi:hypothetical protein